jgi:hypothetical protein
MTLLQNINAMLCIMGIILSPTVFAISGGNLKPPTVTPKAPYIPTPVHSIADAKFQDDDTYPTCPSTISSCQDINGKYVGTCPYPDKTKCCPENCRAERTGQCVNGPSGRNAFPDQCVANSDPDDHSPIYKNIVEAVCPGGYSTIASYRMSREITYVSGQNTVYPTSQTEYDQYVSWGYVCDYPVQVTSTRSACYKTYPYLEGDDVQIDGHWAILSEDPEQVPGKHCSDSDKHKWNVRYQPYFCNSPAGVYPTANVVPTGVICSRIQTQWQ